MNKWQKFRTVAGITGAACAITHIINRIIFSASVSMQVTDTQERITYKWKFGDISYTKKGSKSPVLLIHDLNSISSSYEWSNVRDELAKTHTVYAIDLLGCGYSTKPSITYTAYLYVQLIEDFIKNVIGRRTDVVVTGDSCPAVIMACYNNSALFNNIVLVNPQSLEECAQIPGKRKNIFKILLNTSLIGNSIYNMHVSKKSIKEICSTKLFYKIGGVPNSTINALHEIAHLGGFSSRYLFASARCRYTCANINNALAAINNNIFIIAGDNAINMKNIVREYRAVNPIIESAVIPRSRHLPQFEHPVRFARQLGIFI